MKTFLKNWQLIALLLVSLVFTACTGDDQLQTYTPAGEGEFIHPESARALAEAFAEYEGLNFHHSDEGSSISDVEHFAFEEGHLQMTVDVDWGWADELTITATPNGKAMESYSLNGVLVENREGKVSLSDARPFCFLDEEEEGFGYGSWVERPLSIQDWQSIRGLTLVDENRITIFWAGYSFECRVLDRWVNLKGNETLYVLGTREEANASEPKQVKFLYEEGNVPEFEVLQDERSIQVEVDSISKVEWLISLGDGTSVTFKLREKLQKLRSATQVPPLLMK